MRATEVDCADSRDGEGSSLGINGLGDHSVYAPLLRLGDDIGYALL